MCKKSQIGITHNMGLIRTNEILTSVSAQVVFKTTFHVVSGIIEDPLWDATTGESGSNSNGGSQYLSSILNYLKESADMVKLKLFYYTKMFHS